MGTKTKSILGELSISRRTFTKITAAVAGAVAASGALSKLSGYEKMRDLGDLIAPAVEASPGEKLIPTICSHCAVGCGVYGRVADGELVGLEPWSDHPVNAGSMCSKGTSIAEIVNSETRLKYPMKKEGGKWKKISWDEALSEIADKVMDVKANYGPDSIMWMGSAKVTNEECYLFRKFAAFNGTNNVDHQARICHSTTVAGMANTWSYGAMTNSWNDMRNSKMIFFIGENAAESHPVAMKHILEAKRRGAKFVVADPRFTKSAALADFFVRFRPGTDIPLIMAICHDIIKNDWHDKDFIAKRTYGFEEFKKVVEEYPPEVAEDITWVSAEDIRKIAKMWAENSPACICWAMGATQHTVGTNNIRSFACLEMLTGYIGQPGGGCNAFRGHDNVQGATDMCVLSHWLPAYYGLTEGSWKHWVGVWNRHAPITYEDMKAKFDTIPDPDDPEKEVSMMHRVGLTVSRWYEGVLLPKEKIEQPNQVKMVFVWGHSLNSISVMSRLKEALEKIDMIVGVDPHATIAASLADRPDGIILLPASTVFEKDGSVTNSARQVQWRNKLVEPRFDSKPDLWIMEELAKRLGIGEHFIYNSPEDVLREINLGAMVIAMRQSPERLKKQQQNAADFDIEDCQAKTGPCKGEYWGLPWPCWNDDHPGTPILYRNDIPVYQGGNEFRTRFRGSDSTAGNPVSDDGISMLGAAYGAPEGYDEMNCDGTPGTGWKLELDCDFKDVIAQNKCPSGAGRARFRAWNLPDPVPVHREPIESPRPDLIDKYPTYEDVACHYRVACQFGSAQQERKWLVNDYPLILSSGRQVEHMGGGAETRSSKYLVELQPENYVEINPKTATDLGIKHWDYVWVETLRGKIKVRANLTERVNEKTVFVPYHWAGWFQGKSYEDRYPPGTAELALGDSVNIITADGYDRSTNMQETKVCLCKVYKV
ncbi:MAG: formate dehydrogenase subunit alpha [Halobacteriota archaeon]|nr:formate dehydrogenase subunit alpha [Halobacteriota archaeon]